MKPEDELPKSPGSDDPIEFDSDTDTDNAKQGLSAKQALAATKDKKSKKSVPRKKSTKPIKFRITNDLFKALDSDTQDIIRDLAGQAAKNLTVRIYYKYKVTTGKAVYRTICPYSLRLRNIHTDGKYPDNYKRPAKPTIVLFGVDKVKNQTKMFVADRIQQFEYQGKSFVPKWPVEFGEIPVTESMDDLLNGENTLEECLAEIEFHFEEALTRSIKD